MKGKNDKALKEEFTHFLLDEDDSKVVGDIKQSNDVDAITISKVGAKKLTGPPTQKESQHVSLDASLKQAEYLRAAQVKILDLEKSLQAVRMENEQISTTAIILQRKFDVANSKVENLEKQLKTEADTRKNEKLILEDLLSQSKTEQSDLEVKVSELQSRIHEKLASVRTRERELENRLELLRLENQASLGNKDQIILDLKHKLDQLTSELENSKVIGKDQNSQIEGYKEQVRRTVKALRLALTMLEGENINDLKKTGND